MQDSSSPQHAAFEWLISPLNDQDLSNNDLIQRYALATLYYSTQGKDWEDSSGWLSSEHECDWFKTQDSSEVCNSSKSYIAIDLQENNLDGTLPTEVITLLTSLGKSWLYSLFWYLKALPNTASFSQKVFNCMTTQYQELFLQGSTH